MKLSPRDSARFFTNPDPALKAILIHGPDAMRIALKRQDLVAALLGPNGEAEMRLTRLSGGDLRRDAAALSDAMRAQGFFPGKQVVLVEDANDGLAQIMGDVLDDLGPDDAVLVVIAGQLTARSKLRTLFEKSGVALCAAIYADPASREEIEDAMRRAGIKDVDSGAMTDLTALGRSLDPGDFRQTLEKLALYTLDQDDPITGDDIAACAPATIDAEQDEVYHLAAEGAVDRLGDMLPRIAAQGISPTGLCIGAERHFRQLHAAAAHPQGPDAGLSRSRPPVYGPRKDRMVRQARHWGVMRLESILSVILDTDLALRSPRPVPDMAMVERMFIRIAMLHGR